MAKLAITRAKTCKQCGIQFLWVYNGGTANRGCCSVSCRKSWQSEYHKARRARGIFAHGKAPKRLSPPTPCLQCGTPTKRPRYCSTRCSGIAVDRRKGVISWSERYPDAEPAQQKTCVICQAAFTRRSKGRDSGQCCSRSCGFELRKRMELAPPPTPSWVIERAVYRRWSKRYATKARANQREADRLLRRARSKLLNAITSFIINPQRQCVECSAPIGSSQAMRVYCSTCSHAKAKANKRASKAARRAKERSPAAEVFDPFEIFERDGWRCHMCKCSTPKRYRGTYKDNAPELDHILPLALGGEHTRLNTACSCRKCNGNKGAKALGQMLLVA